jgi:putative SOS response-associated peptidase YedK
MCARYLIKATTRDLAKQYGVKIDEDVWSDEGWSEHKIVPYKIAPVVIEKTDRRIFKPMQFALIPIWSKERKPKFSTFNARLDALSKPTWKGPAQTARCIVPLTHFLEPIYLGEFAGHWVEFSLKDAEILSAAGICSTWVDPKSGEIVESFAMITGAPLGVVKKAGHERSPLFLDEMGVEGWLKDEKIPVEELTEFALEHRIDPKLSVKEDEAMKPGWEKRIPKD